MIKWCNRVANLEVLTEEFEGYIENYKGWTIDSAIGKDKAVLYITLKKFLVINKHDFLEFNSLVKKRFRIE